MRAFGVVPQKPVKEFVVEGGVLDTHRQYRLGEINGPGCPETPVARYREGKANTGALVLCRDEVARYCCDPVPRASAFSAMRRPSMPPAPSSAIFMVTS